MNYKKYAVEDILTGGIVAIMALLLLRSIFNI